MALKYIMIEQGLPVIFGDYFNHSEVAARLKDFGKTTSAGFVRQNADGTFCADGESLSLNLKPVEKDSAILNKLIMKGRTSFL